MFKHQKKYKYQKQDLYEALGERRLTLEAWQLHLAAASDPAVTTGSMVTLTRELLQKMPRRRTVSESDRHVPRLLSTSTLSRSLPKPDAWGTSDTGGEFPAPEYGGGFSSDGSITEDEQDPFFDENDDSFSGLGQGRESQALDHNMQQARRNRSGEKGHQTSRCARSEKAARLMGDQ